MRPGLADEQGILRPKALVLGNPALARLFREGFMSQGVTSYTEADFDLRIGRPHESRAQEALKQLLSEFSQRVGRPPAGGRHYLHPGISRWSERPEFETLGKHYGFNVLAPSPRVVSLFANRLTLLSEAERLGIPHLVLSFDPIQTLREIDHFIRGDRRKFPFVLKSIRGGLDSGIHVIHSEEDLGKKFQLWIDQLRLNFGEAILFPERYIEGAKRITVPFCRFINGEVVTYPLVDSSLQVRTKKIIEFCPATPLEAAVETQLRAWTDKLVQQCSFLGIGSIDFFVDGPKSYIVDGFVGLSESFPIWEKVAGVSALELQIAAIEGQLSTSVPNRKIKSAWKSALSAKIIADDPLLGLPRPGLITEISEKFEWSFAKGEAFISHAYKAGERMKFDEEGIVSMLYVGAPDIHQSIILTKTIMSELWISGTLQTNEKYLSELLSHPYVAQGMIHASFADEEFIPAVRPEQNLIESFAKVVAHTIKDFSNDTIWVVGDQKLKLSGHAPDLSWIRPPLIESLYSGYAYFGEIKDLTGHSVRIAVVPTQQSNRWVVRMGDWSLFVRRIEAGSLPRKSGDPAPLLAQVNGKVHALLYKAGSRVPAREPMVLIESLGSLIPHAAPLEVQVLSWSKQAENSVDIGEELGKILPCPATKEK